jgi:hypothetical protein
MAGGSRKRTERFAAFVGEFLAANRERKERSSWHQQ